MALLSCVSLIWVGWSEYTRICLRGSTYRGLLGDGRDAPDGPGLAIGEVVGDQALIDNAILKDDD